MKLSALAIPTTPAAVGAQDVAANYCTPSLLNHSFRAYIWAAGYAAERNIAYDAELLFVAAMLHDIALVNSFDNHLLPFEEAGAHIAWVFGAGAGWTIERRRRVGEIILRHMWDSVDITQDPEGHLLELSTGMDISGRGTDAISASLRSEVLALYPRLNLGEEFVGFFEDQALRKPTCLAANFVRSGIASRLAANPLDH